MNNIEILIGLLLLFMAVPDVCRRLGRPALVYPAFVLFGLALEPMTGSGVKTMLQEAGAVGFLLLLFQVGLEIDLPQPKELFSPMRFAIPWALVQYPVIFLLARIAGVDWPAALVAAATLTGVSVGMGYPAWKNYPGLADPERRRVLHCMIILETLTIVLLAVEAPALKTGWSWTIPARLIGVGLVILLVARYAAHLTRLFQAILEQTTHWRTHMLVLMVLVICAVGERLGLSAAKTAFFLGLFMSRAEHDGKGLEEFIAPVSRGFLIPIFFVALGLRMEWGEIVSLTGLMAFGAAGLLLGLRELLHRRGLRAGGDSHAYLLLCPNLTVVALGAATLLEQTHFQLAGTWLLLTGMFLTVTATLLLPAAGRTGTVAKA